MKHSSRMLYCTSNKKNPSRVWPSDLNHQEILRRLALNFLRISVYVWGYINTLFNVQPVLGSQIVGTTRTWNNVSAWSRKSGWWRLKGRERDIIYTVSSRFTLVFERSQFRGPDYLGAWNRLLNVSTDIQTPRSRSLKKTATPNFSTHFSNILMSD